MEIKHKKNNSIDYYICYKKSNLFYNNNKYNFYKNKNYFINYESNSIQNKFLSKNFLNYNKYNDDNKKNKSDNKIILLKNSLKKNNIFPKKIYTKTFYDGKIYNNIRIEKKIINDDDSLSFENDESSVINNSDEYSRKDDDSFLNEEEFKINENIIPKSFHLNFINKKLFKEENFYENFYKILNFFNKNYNEKNSKINENIIKYLTIIDINNLCLFNKNFEDFFRKFRLTFIFNKLKNEEEKIELNSKFYSFDNTIFKFILKYSNIPYYLSEKIYFDNLYIPTSYFIEIQNDLLRTFPLNPDFTKNSPFYLKLNRLLNSYSNFNKKIGYAQGLNFIFGRALYLFEKEEKIFIFVDALINRMKLSKIIGINNNLKNALKDFNKKLNENDCEINFILEKLKKNEIFFHDLFTLNWLITLFSNSMREKFLFKIWEFFCLFGMKFFYEFIIVLLKNFKEEFLNLNQNDFQKFMKDIFKTNKFENNFWNLINEIIEKFKENKKNLNNFN